MQKARWTSAVAAAALFGATFTWYLFGGRFHKLRLTSFLKRR